MSNLIPGLIPLENGLNLQTAKIAAPPGSSLDMLNYEQVDFVGQKRIDGYVRYDGNMQPVLDEYLVLTLTSAIPGSPGDLLYVNGEFWGRLLEVDGFIIYVAVYNHRLTPNVGGNITWDGDDLEVASVIEGKEEEGITAEDHYNNLLRFMNVLRGEIGELPPVAGLHWHEDRLYAVADVLAVIVETGEPVSDCAYLVVEGNAFYGSYQDDKIPEGFEVGETPSFTLFHDEYDPVEFILEFEAYTVPAFNLPSGEIEGWTMVFYDTESNEVEVCATTRNGTSG